MNVSLQRTSSSKEAWAPELVRKYSETFDLSSSTQGGKEKQEK